MNLHRPNVNKLKYRKSQNLVRLSQGINSKCNKLIFDNIGLLATEGCFIKEYHMETIRIISLRLLRSFKFNDSKVRFRIKAYKPKTKKPEQVRQGGGKSNVDHYECPVRAGTIICEITQSNEKVAKLLLKQLSIRIPGKIALVNNNNIDEALFKIRKKLHSNKENNKIKSKIFYKHLMKNK